MGEILRKCELIRKLYIKKRKEKRNTAKGDLLGAAKMTDFSLVLLILVCLVMAAAVDGMLENFYTIGCFP